MFCLPAFGIVNGVDLGELWQILPENEAEIRELVNQQTSLKDQPSHRLFQELRKAEADFELELVITALQELAKGEIRLEGGRVLDKEGGVLIHGSDLTEQVVGKRAVWSEGGIHKGVEGELGGSKERMG